MAAQKRHWNWLVLALSAGASGCILPGGDVDPVLHPGTPVGITALRIPVDRFVIPVPAPAGFSSTYQRMLVERQRLARKKPEREAQTKSSGGDRKDDVDAAAKSATPPA